jgi:lysine-specific demethylase 8/hypoxia-inducible factor 1-alpha inhibitor (HIF hydroxylase)
LTANQFANCYRKLGVPVILTDLFNLNADWDLDYLTQQLGDREFLLRYYGRARYEQDKRDWTSIGSGVQTQSQPFRTYAELIRSGEAYQQDIYLGKCSLQATPLAESEPIADLTAQLAELGLQQPASSLNLWIGSGHTECLHYDVMDGTLIQLHGSKQVTLFPPSQTANLYPYPFYAHLRHGLKLRSWFSRVYPNRPDLQAFPKLRAALKHRHDVTLNPGEALYIPAGWWHEVTAIGEDMVCSVNRFWRVYPTWRAWFLGNRWRVYLGTVCAIPKTLLQLGLALLSRNRQQKLKEIRQML